MHLRMARQSPCHQRTARAWQTCDEQGLRGLCIGLGQGGTTRLYGSKDRRIPCPVIAAERPVAGIGHIEMGKARLSISLIQRDIAVVRARVSAGEEAALRS